MMKITILLIFVIQQGNCNNIPKNEKIGSIPANTTSLNTAENAN